MPRSFWYSLPALLLLSTLCVGQNLVPNPGLEQNTPFCGVFGQSDFNQYVVAWSTPTAGSPDICLSTLPTNCMNAAVGSTDPNSWGSEAPAGGSAMAALITYCSICASETREYMQAQLIQPLQVGQLYRASMLVSLGDNCQYATDGLGFHFSVVPPSSNTWPSLPVNAQIKAQQVIGTTDGWVEISGEFVATEAFTFITIGNFDNDAATQVQDRGNFPRPFAVYFVDEIVVEAAVDELTVNGPQSICAGQAATLTATNANGPVSWFANTPAGSPIGTGNSITVQPTATTTYHAVDATDTASFTVSVVQAPTVQLGNDTTLCEGAVLLLNVEVPGATYAWSTGATGPQLAVTTSGNIAVSVSNGVCTVSDSMEVLFVPRPLIDLGNDTTLCPGESLLLDATWPGASYTWSTGNGGPTITVDAAGSYGVSVTVAGCVVWDSLQVNIELPMDLSQLVDASPCLGDSVQVDLSGEAGPVLWWDGSNEVVRSFSNSGVYTVQFGTGQCVYEAQFSLSFRECDPDISMPNVFTPNGDGHNDRFIPVVARGFTDLELVVLNRWGNELFRTRNLALGWSGLDAPEGTYYWVLSYTDQQGAARSMAGHVTLLR